MRILYADGDLLAVVKPVGVPSQPDKTGDADLLRLLAPEFGPLYPIHRLDRPVGGVMVLGRTEAGTGVELLHKEYMAVVCGSLPAAGELTHYLKKRERDKTSFVVSANEKAAKLARLQYETLAERPGPPENSGVDGKAWPGPLQLVKIRLQTGRHHQIRVQMAAARAPLWGDRKYNPAFARYRGKTPLALWAASLTLRDGRGQEHTFAADPAGAPFDWFFGRALGREENGT